MKKNTLLTLICILAYLPLLAQTNTFLKSYTAGQNILWFYANPVPSGYIYIGTKGTDLVWAKADTGGTITACNTYPTSFGFTGQTFLIGTAGYPIRSMIVSPLPGNKVLITCPYGTNGLGLMEIDASGNVQWINKCIIPSISKLSLISVSLSNSGKYAWITGDGYIGKANTGFIIKTDSSGNIALSKSLTIDSTSATEAGFYGSNGMVQDKNNNSYILVSTASHGPYGYAAGAGIWLKTDSLLNIKWAKNGPSQASSLDVRNNKLYALQFVIDIPTGFRYNYIYTYDTSASSYSYLRFPESQAGCTQLQATADGGFLLYGSRSFGQYNSTVIKFNNSNNLQWSMQYNLNKSDMEQISSLMPTKDGGYILSGDASTNTVYNLLEGYIVKTDSAGSGTCYNSNFTYPGSSYGPNSNASFDSVVVITPLFASDSALSVTTKVLTDTIIAYCYDNVLTSTDNVNEFTTKVTVYPNPSHGLFNITMENLSENVAKVEVYNMLGEKMYSADNGSLKMSNSTFSINLSNQPMGIYLYRILSKNNTIATGKIAIQ